MIIPLLERWGWSYRRQVVCPPHASRTVVRGRVDILVSTDTLTEPLTLFEAKRRIATNSGKPAPRRLAMPKHFTLHRFSWRRRQACGSIGWTAANRD
jgi:hypothetical protein